MSKYVDGFVLVVPKDNEEEYQKLAEEARDMWMRHGAIGYFECKGEDLEPQVMGEEQSLAFPLLIGARSDENVWFSFIIFHSKQHRDEVNNKVMAEMDALYKDQSEISIPVKLSRMAYGGFEVAVEALETIKL